MCPECSEPMIAFELEGVEIDRCPNCGGTWLDAGELEWIAELAGAQPGPLTKALESAELGQRGKRRCPRCRRRLRAIMVASEPLVELDRCPYGHGLWFDRGEMRAVISSFADGEGAAVAGFFSDLYHHEIGSESEGD